MELNMADIQKTDAPEYKPFQTTRSGMNERFNAPKKPVVVRPFQTTRSGMNEAFNNARQR